MDAVDKLVTDHLDLWTAAIKRKSAAGRGSSSKVGLYGIKKLRELILELAVRGLLVSQDPNDEPASELLKKIAAEKAKLVKVGKLKKEKPQLPVEGEEKHFQLPSGWAWASINDTGQYVNGLAFKPSDWSDSGRPIIRIQNLSGRNDDFNRTERAVDESVLVYNGDLLVSWSATLDVFVWGKEEVGVLNQHIFKVVPTQLIDKNYLFWLLKAAIKEMEAGEHAHGLVMTHINRGPFLAHLIALPPADEQRRIAQKVKDLMALCDQLEQETETGLSAHQMLVETLLNAMTNAADHAEFASAWQRIAEHFETLFTTEESLDQLKQTILQLAVMGKLVPQDTKDEPASELLKKIAAEKATLAKEGKIKNHLPVEPIGKSQVLPDSWVEIVVQDFADIRLGSTPSRAEPKFWNGDIPWVSSGEVANCIIRDTFEKITREGFENSSTSVIPARSLLMAIIGQGKTRGQTALLEIDACTNQNVAAFVFNERFVCPEYVWIWAKSKYESHRDDGHGGAQPALNGKKVRSFRFPLAPITEQHRIVAKVEELTVLCDQLKSCLNDAQTTQLHLADAITEKSLARP